MLLTAYTLKTLILFALMVWCGWMLRTDKHGNRF